MRIVAGRYKGRLLRAAPGTTTRPTTDRVREAWASTLGSLCTEGFAGASVLDAFAGSGALGLEALSRGASSVLFCERDRRALDALDANRASLEGAEEESSVLALDVFSPKAVGPLRRSGPYDLVLLDPPYACHAGKLQGLLHSLAVTGALRTGALVTYEHLAAAGTPLDGAVLCAACSPASLHMVSCKTYGTTQIDYLRYR
ncbi:MAG: 16S rRNA (guanine(966)-N(2))-methyltransferase RsmD [Coriobacteriales bacterium]|jgi:16S rRNA (guanine966-N2)-methyltransferase|nr:16S rRNA (guanine(966)-N(2))-methyltransferase RsmD [Coriobacteriales bacterium]